MRQPIMQEALSFMDMQVAARPVFQSTEIPLRTQGPRQFIDLTEEVRQRVSDADVNSGLVVVSSRHTTAALLINEHEPLLLKDLDRFLSGLAPTEADYAHNAVPCLPGEQPNAHAHCQALLLQSSVTIPVVNGVLALGRWQRIFLVELDCARSRSVLITLLGA